MVKQRSKKAKRGRRKKRSLVPALGGLVGQILPELSKGFMKEVPGMLSSLFGAFPLSNVTTLAAPGHGGLGQAISASAPAANTSVVKTTIPRIKTRQNGTRICHREFISNINAPANEDELNNFQMAFMGRINPGNSRVFPWLSSIATRFETFNFRSLRFIYEMRCGTQNEGSVMIVVDYDAVDPPPVSKEQMMSYAGAARVSPWYPCSFNCANGDLHKAKTYYVTKTETNPPNTDAKTYYAGTVYCATETAQLDSATPFGELYVEYEVDLLTPILDSFGSSQFGFAGISSGSLFVAGAEVFGSLPVMFDDTPTNNLLNSTFYIEQPGLYLATLYYLTPSVVAPVVTLSSLPGATTLNTFTGTTIAGAPFSFNIGISANYGTSAVNYVAQNFFYVSAPPGGIEIVTTTAPNGNVFFMITPCDPVLNPLLGAPISTSFRSSRAKMLAAQRKPRKNIPRIASAVDVVAEDVNADINGDSDNEIHGPNAVYPYNLPSIAKHSYSGVFNRPAKKRTPSPSQPPCGK